MLKCEGAKTQVAQSFPTTAPKTKPVNDRAGNWLSLAMMRGPTLSSSRQVGFTLPHSPSCIMHQGWVGARGHVDLVNTDLHFFANACRQHLEFLVRLRVGDQRNPSPHSDQTEVSPGSRLDLWLRVSTSPTDVRQHHLNDQAGLAEQGQDPLGPLRNENFAALDVQYPRHMSARSSRSTSLIRVVPRQHRPCLKLLEATKPRQCRASV